MMEHIIQNGFKLIKTTNASAKISIILYHHNSYIPNVLKFYKYKLCEWFSLIYDVIVFNAKIPFRNV